MVFMFPTILRLIYKIKGVERACVITDALACAASESNVAFDPRVIIEDGVCKLADRSALAGSVATMDRLIRTLVQRQKSRWKMLSVWLRKLRPRLWEYMTARAHFRKGKDADILILDQDLNIRAVWAMGKLVEGTCTL